jgi:ferrous iron transport protein A
MAPGTPLTLDQLAIGQTARVRTIHQERTTTEQRRADGQDPIRRRLLEMGLCPEVEVEVLRRAPLGDPIELRVRGYLLSVRAEHARQVEMQPVTPP